MKTQLFGMTAFLLIVGLLPSCNTTDNPENESGNYWTSNSLVRLQLRGDVKTLTENNGATVNRFNTDGNLTSKVTTYESGSDATTYSYENGKLISETNTYTNSANLPGQRSAQISTTYYEYENVGKIIPRGPIHLMHIGLAPGLSAVIYTSSRMDFTFHGNDLWIVTSETDGTTNVPTDTIVVTYSGNYPVSFQNDWSFCNNMTYASNGMFVTYNEGFYGTGYNDTRAYTFLANDKYQLISSMVNVVVSDYNNTTSTTNYTYNDHFDLLTQGSTESMDEYSDYVYDTQDNWTSRKYRYFSTGNGWGEYTTETRVIEYY
jgi:hypothetical protein